MIFNKPENISIEVERMMLLNKLNIKLNSLKTDRQKRMFKVKTYHLIATELGIDSFVLDIRKLNLEQISAIRKMVTNG